MTSRLKAFVLLDLVGSKNIKFDEDGNSATSLLKLFEEAANEMGEGQRMYEFPSDAEIADAAGADDDLRASLGDEVDAWLDLLLSTRVIPSFATDRLAVLRHYPSTQAALARLCPDDRDGRRR
mgnify:CR=1 FL=1